MRRCTSTFGSTPGWTQVQTKAKEAWVYPLGWVLYMDDTAVVSMIRERGAWDKHDDQ